MFYKTFQRLLRISTGLAITVLLIAPILVSGRTLAVAPSGLDTTALRQSTIAATPLPLGSFRRTTATDTTCPANFTCQGFEVTCPDGVGTLPGFLGIAEPTRAARGLALFARGGGGTEWTIGGTGTATFLANLRADGFKVVQIRWKTNWLVAPSGVRAGTAHLGCRPATVIKWVHSNLYLPMGLPAAAPGICGFCITGNSGGSTQVSFALSHYGLDGLLQAVIPSGGPPHSVLQKACLQNADEREYWFSPDTRSFIDDAWGYASTTGPCYRNDPSFIQEWSEESVSTGGSDYYHPSTRVHFILGGNDTPMHPHAQDYHDRLRNAGSPRLTWQVIPGMGHSIMGSSDGQAALRAALLATSP